MDSSSLRPCGSPTKFAVALRWQHAAGETSTVAHPHGPSPIRTARCGRVDHAGLDVARVSVMGSTRVRDIEVDGLDNTTDVETPERIRFRYHVAGPVRRGLAYLLDLLIRGAVLSFTALLLVGAGAVDAGKARASWGLWLIVLFVLEWGWNVLFETFWRGRTIGKRVLGLRVVREEGYPVGFVDSVLRNLLRAADFLPVGYIVGLLVMAGDSKFRRLGDRIAGTMVAIDETVAIASPIVLSPPPTAAEWDVLPHRPPITPGEAEAIELFLRRADLSPARRAEMAATVAPTLARRMGVPVGDAVRFLGLVHQRTLAARRPAGREPESSAPP